MPKKSRRLPGGKVRKPIARPARPAQTASASAAVAAAARSQEALESQSVLAADRGDQIDRGDRGARAAPVRRPPAAGPAGPPRLRPAAVAAPRARAPAPRAGRSLIDAAAANYTHIRADLAKIGILAAIMLAIIVGLSFVLR